MTVDLLYCIFLCLLYLPVHSYVIYPITILLMAKIFKQKKNIINVNRKISVIIAAYNEEKVIEERVKNIYDLNYDLSNIELLIGSDNSTDNTNIILQKLEKQYPFLKTFYFKERQGKAGIINNLVLHASHEILVFTDANTNFEKDSIQKIINEFENDEVGGVSGKLLLLEPESNTNKSNEEKTYWDYEVKIKEAEGELGILIGANGGIFAIRKELFERIPIKRPVTDDFFISLTVLNKKKKFLYLDNAVATEFVAHEIKQEFNRKVRFSATNYQTVFFFPQLMFNKNFLITYAYNSHKILRWIIPLIYLPFLIINVFLFDYNQFSHILFYIQLLFWLAVFVGYLLSKVEKRCIIFSLPYFFVLTNIAVLLGFFRFVTGRHSVIWQSTQR